MTYKSQLVGVERTVVYLKRPDGNGSKEPVKLFNGEGGIEALLQTEDQFNRAVTNLALPTLNANQRRFVNRLFAKCLDEMPLNS